MYDPHNKLIEELKKLMKELEERCQKAYRSYDTLEYDRHQLGLAEAYDFVEQRIREIIDRAGEQE